jgi:predicted dithiol-disulfide oxidoreductase (DUF899 family)
LPQCSFWADNFNGIIVHLNHRDVTLVAVSQAPYSKIATYLKRMGWSFYLPGQRAVLLDGIVKTTRGHSS